MDKTQRKSRRVRFDKSMTNIVKGFAILFMIILHSYGNHYDVPLDLSHAYLLTYSGAFKICVGMFTFMVGFGYAFSKTKDLRYGWQHIKKLLIPFWTILFVFTLPFSIKKVVDTDVMVLLYNLVGIDSSFNYYSWFVYFFIFAMLEMPLVSRFINLKPVCNTAIVVVAAVLLSVIVHEIPRFLGWFGIQVPNIVDNKPLLALFFSLSMTPPMVLGYLFAHEGFYERINIGRISKSLAFLLGVAMIILALVLHHLWSPIHIPFQFDFFYAPLMIGGIVILFNKFEWKLARKTLIKLGEVSVYMWFFHALFFTAAVKWFYQPVVTIFSNPYMVVLWVIVLTFIASWLIKRLVDGVVRLLS